MKLFWSASYAICLWLSRRVDRCSNALTDAAAYCKARAR